MKIFHIAINTLREAIKDKLIYSLLFVGMLLILSSLMVVELTFIQREKIMLDVGLAAISLCGILVSIFGCSTLLGRELELKRIYSIFSKPVSRMEFLIGKYFGIVIALTINTVVLTFFLLIVVLLKQHTINLAVFKASYLMLLELMVLSAIVLFFSSFTTTFLTMFYALLMLVVGHMLNDVKAYWASKSIFTIYVTKFIYYFFPNLEIFNVRSLVVHRLPVDYNYLSQATLYGFIYIGFFLFVAIIIFRTKDLE